jgi:hypothetical protein
MMKKATLVAVLTGCLSFLGGLAVAQRVHDWHDIDKVREHVHESIHEIETIQAANSYNMGGHAEAAKSHLRQAEGELQLAIQTVRGQ